MLCQMQQTKKNRSRKIGDKDGKELYNLMNNAVYGNNGKLEKKNRYETFEQ